MAPMRKEKKLLLIVLFMVASFVTALHELSPHHHAQSCQVCMVDDHTLSFDVITTPQERDLLISYDVAPFTCKLFVSPRHATYSSRAPPSLT
jgi:hypothetical protein